VYLLLYIIYNTGEEHSNMIHFLICIYFSYHTFCVSTSWYYMCTQRTTQHTFHQHHIFYICMYCSRWFILYVPFTYNDMWNCKVHAKIQPCMCKWEMMICFSLHHIFNSQLGFFQTYKPNVTFISQNNTCFIHAFKGTQYTMICLVLRFSLNSSSCIVCFHHNPRDIICNMCGDDTNCYITHRHIARRHFHTNNTHNILLLSWCHMFYIYHFIPMCICVSFYVWGTMVYNICEIWNIIHCITHSTHNTFSSVIYTYVYHVLLHMMIMCHHVLPCIMQVLVVVKLSYAYTRHMIA